MLLGAGHEQPVLTRAPWHSLKAAPLPFLPLAGGRGWQKWQLAEALGTLELGWSSCCHCGGVSFLEQ